MFCNLLKKLELKSNDSRKEIIAKLQMYHPIFSSLDEITFSRWVTGYSQPSMLKIILLNKYFSAPLTELIELIPMCKISQKEHKAYDRLFTHVDDSYHRVSYYPENSEQVYLKHSSLSTDDHREQLGSFYNSFGTYRFIFQKMDDNHHTTQIELFTLEWCSHILSHTSYIHDFSQFAHYLNISINTSNERSILINVSYYTYKHFYAILFGSMLNHVIEHHTQLDSVYIAFRGQLSIAYIESIGGEIIWSKKETNLLGNIYIARFDFNTLISNPMIFNFIKGSKSSYEALKKNGNIYIKDMSDWCLT